MSIAAITVPEGFSLAQSVQGLAIEAATGDRRRLPLRFAGLAAGAGRYLSLSEAVSGAARLRQ